MCDVIYESLHNVDRCEVRTVVSEKPYHSKRAIKSRSAVPNARFWSWDGDLHISCRRTVFFIEHTRDFILISIKFYRVCVLLLPEKDRKNSQPSLAPHSSRRWAGVAQFECSGLVKGGGEEKRWIPKTRHRAVCKPLRWTRADSWRAVF